jgi:tetratricopeptide (TPR) repeat protein
MGKIYYNFCIHGHNVRYLTPKFPLFYGPMNHFAQNAMRIFISYANADDDYYRLFKSGFENRIKRLGWEIWTDQKILPGENWHQAIQEKVNDCECAILLLSSNFFSSDYIENEELTRFLEHQQNKGILIIPVELLPSPFEEHPVLRERQIFRPHGKDFEKPDLTNVTFGDVVRENQHRQLVSTPRSDRFLEAFVQKLREAKNKVSPPALPTLPSGSFLTHQPTPARPEPTFLDNSLYRGLGKIVPPDAYFDTYKQGYYDFKLASANLDQATSSDELARVSQLANLLSEALAVDIANFRGKIYDSDHLKSLYPKINFEEIILPKKLGLNTIETIVEKRQERSRHPWHERSLIVSALTLRLLRRFDEKAVYHLLDFVRDREELVWKKALTGLVMAYQHHEQKEGFKAVTNLREDLGILRDDPVVAEALLEITEWLARGEEDEKMGKDAEKIKFDQKFEFFQQIPNWFLPFYPNNPVLQEQIHDPELRELILNTDFWQPDALKYAACLRYSQFSPEEQQEYLRELRKQHLRDNVRYNFIRHLSSGLDKEAALRRSREVLNHVRQLRFFLQYFDGGAFRDFVLEKAPLYQSNLIQFILREQWQNKLRAIWLYLEDKYDEAIPCFQLVLSKEPNHLFFRSRLGRMYHDKGKFDEAIESLLLVVEYYPTDTWALYFIASCYSKKRDYEECLAYRQKIVEIEPKVATYWSDLSIALSNLERYDEAIEKLKKAAELDPNFALNFSRIAWYYGKLRDYEQCCYYGQKAIDLGTENAASWGMFGAALENFERFDEAIEKRKKAEELDPKLVWNLRGLASCFHNKKDYELCLEYRQKIVEIEPNVATNWSDLGNALANLERYDEAIEKRKKAEELNSQLIWNLKGLAWCYNKIRDYEIARAYRQKVLELEPEDATNWSTLGAALENLERWEEAIEKRKKAGELDPDFALNFSRIAWCYGKLRDYEQCCYYGQKAINLDIENADCWGMFGAALEYLERFDEAIEKRKKAEELDPKLVWNLRGLASCFQNKKDYEQCLAYHLKVVALEPADASNWFSLGKIYFHLNQPQPALKSIKKGLNLAPEDLDALHAAGWAYFVGNHLSEAKGHFQKSLTLGFAKRHADMNLGHIFLIEKNEPKALEHYQHSFEKADDIPRHLKGFEEDFQYLERNGITAEDYWRVIRQAQAAAGK